MNMRHFSAALIATAQFVVISLTSLQAQPVITKEPEDQTIIQGQDAIFTVEATGTPPLTYQWRAYENLLRFTDIADATNATLVLKGPQPSTLRYRVMVSNSEGDVLSRFALLTVLVPPTISIPPAPQLVKIGQAVDFSVMATSVTQPLSYQWQLNGQDLPGETSNHLLLSNIQYDNAGHYAVVVGNAAGSVVSRAARLSVVPERFDHHVPLAIATAPDAPSPAVKLAWPTVPGKSYGLLATNDLDQPFVPHHNEPIRARSTITTFVDAAEGPAEFYQAYEEVLETGNTAPITVTSIEEWEKVVGLNYTSTERNQMLGLLSNTGQDINRVSYEAIRALGFQNSDSLSLVFSPLPVGFTFETVQHPVTWSPPQNVTRPSNIEDLAFYSVRDLGELIRQRLITATELTELCLARLKQHDPTLLCVINLTEDLARAQAARADAELEGGTYRGPLHGIPYGIKDLFAARNYPTTWGAAPFQDQVIDQDATVVKKLEEAGAVLVAKLSMGELAFGDLWFGGRTRNPWNTSQGSSGSSAGPASATSAGLVPFAIGTETLGSIVSPSTRCRVTGLRPTFGRVSRSGGMVLSWSMDKVGPIARSVEDCALVFDAIRGTDGLDQSVVDAPFNYDAGRDLTGLRVGYRSGLNQATLDQLSTIAGGAELVEITLPEYPVQAMLILMFAEAAAAFDELTRLGGDDFLIDQSPSGWANTFRTARTIPAVEYLLADRARQKLMQEMALIMNDIDLYVAPNSDVDTLFVSNYTGHPCVVLPNGAGTSLCFLGQLYDEATLLSFAKAYQDATGFHTARPPLFIP